MSGDDFGQADALESWEQVFSIIHALHLLIFVLTPLTVAKL